MQTKRKPLLPGTGVPGPTEIPLHTNFGTTHDRQRVMLVFSRPVNDVILQVSAAEAWIKSLQEIVALVKSGGPWSDGKTSEPPEETAPANVTKQ